MNFAETRKANLRKLAAEKGTVELAQKLGLKHASYISQMCGPSANRPVSEKNARRFEELLGLEVGWFDVNHEANAQAPATTADLVAEVIRLVGATLGEEGVTAPASRFADLVALAYLDAVDHGGASRQDHVKSLVRLLK